MWSPDLLRFRQQEDPNFLLPACYMQEDSRSPALVERRPLPGWMHHFDRGVQCASGEYVATLLQYHAMNQQLSGQNVSSFRRRPQPLRAIPAAGSALGLRPRSGMAAIDAFGAR
jgi:hypothetical protein